LVDPQKRFIEHTYVINRLECVFYTRAHSESLVNVTTVGAVRVGDEIDCYVLKGMELVIRRAGEQEGI
jgi:hypothetical protein